MFARSAYTIRLNNLAEMERVRVKKWKEVFVSYLTKHDYTARNSYFYCNFCYSEEYRGSGYKIKTRRISYGLGHLNMCSNCYDDLGTDWRHGLRELLFMTRALKEENENCWFCDSLFSHYLVYASRSSYTFMGVYVCNDCYKSKS